jgi:hypothetical protein
VLIGGVKMSFSRRRSSVANAAEVLHHDEDKLAELGYKQELNRSWSLLHNFGVSFSIIVSQASPKTIYIFNTNT